MIMYMRRKGFSWETIVKITGFTMIFICQQNVSPVHLLFRSITKIYFIFKFLKALNSFKLAVIDPLIHGFSYAFN